MLNCWITSFFVTIDMNINMNMNIDSESHGAPACQVCGVAHLREVEGFGLLPRISSDCRSYPAGGRLFVCIACGAVQKLSDENWLREVKSIYAGYEVYYQSGGDEQIVFDHISATPRRRSDVIVERLVAGKHLEARGHALDVGCGNGSTLSAMSVALPDWSFSGFELGEGTLSRLSQISHFMKLYTGSVGTIDRTFDLVTLIHSLEHFPNPLDALMRLRAIVGNGRLLIQVCNVEENPFDILVADHLMHFSPDALRRLLQRAGFDVITVATDWVPKEISLLAKVNVGRFEGSLYGLGLSNTAGETKFRQMTVYIEWLKNLVLGARDIACEERQFGIFGTSIAATWLAGQLGQRISFFVDEDESRIGKEHFGRPIVRPSDIPAGGIVYIALAPGIAAVIVERLASLPCTLIAPPSISNMAVL